MQQKKEFAERLLSQKPASWFLEMAEYVAFDSGEHFEPDGFIPAMKDWLESKCITRRGPYATGQHPVSIPCNCTLLPKQTPSKARMEPLEPARSRRRLGLDFTILSGCSSSIGPSRQWPCILFWRMRPLEVQEI